ncbi:MAG: hypothetical protein HQ541_15810 [Mariniphaga sp.]|nr:hypothetical protein [Mariniphaga sp.]
MKKILLIISILIIVSISNAQVKKVNQRQLNIQLAVKYYNEKDYEKAAPLLKEVISAASSKHYFKLYLTSLIQLKQFDEVENEIKNDLKRKRFSESELYVHWGYLLKVQNRDEESVTKFDQAVKSIPNNRISYLNTANLFIQWKEYEYAKNIYLTGRKKLPAQQFSWELGNAHYYLREFDEMMEEFLDFIVTDEKRLAQIQARISNALSLDVADELKSRFRNKVLKRIQANPNLIVYNQLYIWFLLQEQNFAGALRQTIALDRRTGTEDPKISNLANMAVNNRDYENARRAYEYLMAKGEENPFYLQSFIQNLQVSYLIFEESSFSNIEQGYELAENFKTGIEFLNYMPITYRMIKEYAHLMAFYLNRPDSAINELEKGIRIRGLTPEHIGVLKTELADIYVYADDPWEATLIYSQVIEANKENELGNQAKLKKARLSYYLGNFDWAQAQLDVIKASTSKLTSNDAFELSLLIGNNLNLDTTEIPLQMFARADFQFFRNEDTLAMATLDSLESLYPYHSLIDDILYRKAKINIKTANYLEATANLEKIITGFSYETLADDALFLLADTYHYYLKDTEKAQELYNNMLVIHPGSIYIVESRKRFRELRGDKLEDETIEENEYRFFNGINP